WTSPILIPITFAHSWPVSVLRDISDAVLDMIVEIALPPISARTPSEVSEVASASTSASLILSEDPIPAIRIPIVTISSSVAAKLLPNSTMVEPYLSASALLPPMMFVIRAIAIAASSADRTVLEPILIIVSVKLVRCFSSTPNCAATAATSAISSYVAGIVLFNSRKAKSYSRSSESDASIILFKSAIAVSYLANIVSEPTVADTAVSPETIPAIENPRAVRLNRSRSRAANSDALPNVPNPRDDCFALPPILPTAEPAANAALDEVNNDLLAASASRLINDIPRPASLLDCRST